MNVQQELKKLEDKLESEIRQLDLQIQEKYNEALEKANQYAQKKEFVVENRNGDFEVVQQTFTYSFLLRRLEVKWDKKNPRIVDYKLNRAHKKSRLAFLVSLFKKNCESLLNLYTAVLEKENEKQKFEILRLKNEMALCKRLLQTVRGKNTQVYNVRQFYIDLYRCGIPISESLHILLFGKLLAINATIYKNNKKIEKALIETGEQGQLEILQATLNLSSYFTLDGEFVAQGKREDFGLCLGKYLHFLLYTNSKTELAAPELDDISYGIEKILSKSLPIAYDKAYDRYADELVQKELDSERRELEALRKTEEEKALKTRRKAAREELRYYYSSNIILNPYKDLERFEELLDLTFVPIELKKELMEKMTKETHTKIPITNFSKQQQAIYERACAIEGSDEISYRLGEVNTALDLLTHTDDTGLRNDLMKEVAAHLTAINEVLPNVVEQPQKKEVGLKVEFV